MKDWKQIIDGYWEYESSAWVWKPIDANKFLLVSWRMAGSEFAKELIRENFPETTPNSYWAKSHIILDWELTKKLIDVGTKVFVIISDPRDITLNLNFFDNGMHISEYDYEMWRYNNIAGDKLFFNEVAEKQIALINHYKEYFGDNCIVLRYEDSLHYQKEFLNKVSNLLGTTPLGIDGAAKYKRSIYKNVGDFNRFFTKEALEGHYNEYKKYYEEWNYPFEGLVNQLKYDWFYKPKEEKKPLI